MKIAARIRSVTNRPFVFGVAFLTAMSTVGAAWITRGPDLAFVPEFVAVPFVMSEGQAIYVQKYEVTIAEWNRCHDEGSCATNLIPQPGMVPETTPATGLSYLDVTQYLEWINHRSRHTFRLPTLTEWEAMAAEVLPEVEDPIFTDPSLTWASAYLLKAQSSRALRMQGSWKTSSIGIADLDGSVWEWTQECYAGDGGADGENCPAYFVGGEHIAAMSFLVSDPAFGGCAVGTPPAHLGMRLVSDTPIGPSI